MASSSFGVMAALLAAGATHQGMHLHPWYPKYIHNESKRLDKAKTKRSMNTKERVEARKKK